MKTLLINKKSFIDWYFDEDVKKTFFDDHNIFLNLLANGVFTIKVNDLLKQAGYLPEEVAEEGQDLILNDDGEIDKSAYDVITFSSKIKVTLQKEEEFIVGKKVVKYYIYANGKCVDVCNNEISALESFEKTKKYYCDTIRETIKEEFV
jgi:uncharacterized protein YifE (UPF0438 family)